MCAESHETNVATAESGWSALRAFRSRNFSIYFAGQLVSMIGTWSQMLAVSWLVWRLTGSPIWLGVTGFAMQLPTLILGLAGGAIADRYDRLGALRVAQFLAMLQALALAWLALTHSIALWQVMLLCAALGTIYAFEMPMRQAFLADLVGKEELLNATSLVNGMTHASRVLGPVVAGIVVAWKGEAACFLLNAAAFLAFILALSLLDRGSIAAARERVEPIVECIREGLQQLRMIRDARLSIALIAVLAGIGMQFTTLMPMFADEVFGGGIVQLGWLMAASSAGSLCGALWLAARRNSERLLALAAKCAVVFSAALISFGISPSIYPAICLLAVMGFCFTVSFSSMGTLMQIEAPENMRGRMMSLYTMAYVGIGPIGYVTAGFVARAIGAQATVAVSGVLCVMASGWILLKAREKGLRVIVGE